MERTSGNGDEQHQTITMKTEETIGLILKQKQMTISTAESCTGGTIASMLTSVPGSSEYFLGGVVSYCNEVKRQVLGVSKDDLDKYGAVSRPVVEQMALGVKNLMQTDCAVATSGIAGPGGGTAQKPVGTVWIAAVAGDRIVSKCFHFGNERSGNIRCSAETALLMLYELLHSGS